jgi:hypothetical protein
MNDRIETDKPIIEPVYSQNEPNEPIDIGWVTVRFDFQGVTCNKEANATMAFLPGHSLKFTVPFEDSSRVWKAWSQGDFEVRLTLIERGVTFDCQWATVDGNMVFSPMNSAVTVTQPCSTISTATFHLFNFPEFRGSDNYVLQTGEPPLQGFKTCGRAILKADGWIVTIAATNRTDDLEKQLRAKGGYVITHIGQIVREDGAEFTSEELDDVLTCLCYFLSLTLGRWVGTELPIGFDCSGNRVFERWGMGRTTQGPWKSFCSWFHEQHGDLLSQVFPGFMLIWKSDLWHTPLAHALYWYIGACRGGAGIGVDTGLILAQTALELLAWTYCVQDQRIEQAKKFKPGGLSAANKFKLLAKSMGIPIDIPPGLSALHGTPEKKWDDGMEAIASIRNSLVHPDNQLAVSNDSYWQAYMLSLWFINLAFLRLCNHNGLYANILPTTSGLATVDRVPWAKSDSDKV